MEIISFVIDIIGLCVSIWTLIVALMFKKRLVERNEKHSFAKEKEDFCQKLMAEYKSYSGEGNLYTPFQLTRTRLLIHEFKKKFTFIDNSLKKQISITYDLITEKCTHEAEHNKSEYRIQLCEEIHSLVILIRKEEVF